VFSEIITHIKSVPDVIWSGVIAAVISLAGVWLSNGGNNKRLNAQLQHDAREKSRDRIMSIRREVYLQVVADIEITNIHIGNLAQRDLTELNISSELQAISSSIAKLKLVAEPGTAKLAAQLSMAFGAVFLKHLARLVPLQDFKNEIEISNDGYTRATNETVRIEHEINKLNDENVTAVEKLQALKDARAFSLDTSQMYADERAKAYERYNAKLQEINALLLPEMKELSKVQLMVLIAIRGDLGVASDPEDFQRQLELQWSVVNAEFSNTMDSINSK
jgi:hypothetical protein